jgi:hypothetical protein
MKIEETAVAEDTQAPDLGVLVDELLQSAQQEGLNGSVEPIEQQLAQAEEPEAMPEPVEQQSPVEAEPVQKDYSVTYANRIWVIPGAIKPEDLGQFIRQQPQFEEIIDKKTGADAGARMAVGSKSDVNSRLATAQIYYSDAQPYGSDNFIYTSPETGLPTLFNEEGLSWGDAAAFTRDIYVGAWGGLGAIGGTATAGPGVGTYGGVAVGTLAGGEIFDGVMEFFGVTKEKRDIADQMIGLVVEGAGSVVGHRAGELIEPLFHSGVSAGRRRMTDIFNIAKDLDIDLTPAILGGGRSFSSKVQAALEATPVGSQKFFDATNKIFDQIAVATNNMANKLGVDVTKSKEELGGFIRKYTEKARKEISDRFGAEYDNLIDDIGRLGGNDMPVSLKNLENVKLALLEATERTPSLRERPSFANANKLIDDILSDVNAGMRFEDLKLHRSSLREMMAFGSEARKDIGEANLERIYRALTDDLASTASAVDPSLATRYAGLNKDFQKWATTDKELLAKILDTDFDEEIYRIAFRGINDGGSRLRSLKEVFTPDEWSSVAGSFIKRLGYGKEGAPDQFNVAHMLKQLQNMSESAKDELFNNVGHADLRASLDDLTKLLDNIATSGADKNHPNTAATLHLLNGLSSLSTGVYTGDPIAAAVQASLVLMGTDLLPRAASHLMLKPWFIKWLAKPLADPIVSVPAHIGRLSALAAEYPDSAEEIAIYTYNLQQISDTNTQKEPNQ